MKKEEVIKKVHADETLKKGKKTLDEFKKFIAKGNVINLAVAVIIGDAFGKIVSSIVDDILMPIIGAIIGGVNFTSLSIVIGEATITYGNFLQNVIDFLIIAICIFFFVKLIDKIMKKPEEEEPKAPEKNEQTVLLEEIRDLLKERV